MKHCLRSNGTERAWFPTKVEAVAFAETTPNYFGDVPHLCLSCGFWHLARPEWLQNPEYLATVASFTEAIN